MTSPDPAFTALHRYAGHPPKSPETPASHLHVPWSEYTYWWDHTRQTEILADIKGDPDRYTEDPHDNLNPF